MISSGGCVILTTVSRLGVSFRRSAVIWDVKRFPRMKRFPVTTIVASLFGLFHLVVVVAPFVAAGGVGEAVLWRTILFDCPLFWLVTALHLDSVFDQPFALEVFVTVFGTLMYAAVGAGTGDLVDRIRRPRRQHVA